MNNRLMGFRQNLRKYRKAAQLTQEQLAHACGFPGQSRIANYENGTRDPSFEDLERLADALGVAQAKLLGADMPEVHAGNDIIALQIAMRSLVKAVVENIPAAAPVFVQHVKDQAREEDDFSTGHALLASVLGIAALSQHTAVVSSQPLKRRGSGVNTKR